MALPLGLDLKSLIVGIILALYVYPLIVAKLSKPKATATA